jgi:catechol 2,3-dioxygenase-like lactoylglutathione lyase family enzyme
MITGISHVTLAVKDVDTSFHFYTQVLGCRAVAK